MSIPRHNNPTDPRRVATAPYNFVPLPDRVASAPTRLPPHDRYDPGRHTGVITCRLTTASPLYIRSGESPEDFSKENKEQSPDFFTDPVTGEPVIPGSSLRGMLRAMIEIVSYSKVQPVSSQKLFYRAVADKMTTLRESYQRQIQQVKAGYVQENRGNFEIIPAIEPVPGRSFYKVKEYIVEQGKLPGFVPLTSDGYRPQRIPCSFRLGTGKEADRVLEVATPGRLPYEGILACSGPMQGKKAHWIVPRRKEGVKPVPIAGEVVADYREAMSEFEKDNFDPKCGCLQPNQPIFYLEDKGTVVAFGHTANFRLPYRDTNQHKALSPRDFVPESLRNPDETDLAEALFGYIENDASRRPKAFAGRVFVTDARLDRGQANDDIWLAGAPDKSIEPKVLSGPKPTTFAHYLTQQDPDYLQRRGKDGKTRPFLSLSHYAQPGKTVLRGHKLYWHQGAQPAIANDKEGVKETQLTRIKPLKPGVAFTFTLHFENLNQVELGALLWVLHLGADENYRLKLGMGKPLGMGAVKTEASLKLVDRQQRYGGLFEGNT